MINIDSIGIHRVLIAVFGAFTLAIVAQGITSINQVNNMAGLFSGMYQDHLLPLNQLRQVENDLKDLRLLVFKSLKTFNPTERAELEARIKNKISTLNQQLELHQLTELQLIFKRSTDGYKRVMDLHYNLQQNYEQMIVLISDIVISKTKQSEQSLKSGQKIQDNIQRFMIVIMLVGVVLTIVTSFFVVRKIAIPMQRKNKELEQLNETLSQMDKLKDDFLANTSHELRTPLHGIIGISESLLDGVGGSVTDIQTENIGMIIQSSRRLANLVDDILDFSKMKQHDLQLDFCAVDINSVCNIVVSIAKALIGNKPVVITKDIPQDLPLVMADENRLHQILLNLIGNSVKFTHEGEIKVIIEPQFSIEAIEGRPDSVLVSISDTGIGISKDKYQQIFQSFEQFDASTSREYGGTGLGLAVTKKLVELHGSTIDVDSQVGVGSTFSFSIPIAADTGARANYLENVSSLAKLQAADSGFSDAIVVEAVAATESLVVTEPDVATQLV
ncbi:MAG: MCP four helix bundle domain-containing protein, partial [Algicola sp.]|nr:MCP four helix bundle domain-containing protein [Algicola sp.]